tara:strand:+ start:155 stop:1072 length:918 start_codon:yes stop_codon:yes gene_type:complete
MSNEKVLITGANGFLGSRILKLFLSRNYEVIGCYLNKNNNLSSFLKYTNFYMEKLDLNDGDNIRTILAKYKPCTLINCAAYGVLPSNKDQIKILNTNLNGTINLFKESNNNNVKRFIQFGSCFEYGSHKGKINEDAKTNPSTFYGLTKLAATKLLITLSKNLDISIVILRPFGIWGPNESIERLVPQIIKSSKKNKFLKLTNGEQIRDYTFVDDIAEWTFKILNLTTFPNGQIFNLGSSKVKLSDFAKLIAKKLNSEHLLKFGYLPYRENEMMELHADNTKLIKYIGKLKCTSVNKGLEIMLKEN